MPSGRLNREVLGLQIKQSTDECQIRGHDPAYNKGNSEHCKLVSGKQTLESLGRDPEYLGQDFIRQQKFYFNYPIKIVETLSSNVAGSFQLTKELVFWVANIFLWLRFNNF